MDKEEIIIGTKKEKEKEKMAMYINGRILTFSITIKTYDISQSAFIINAKFYSALKSRISETQKEIKVLKDEANLLEKETASHSAYQARYVKCLMILLNI